MIPIPPRKSRLSDLPAVWQHCSNCGQGRCLAIGYNALDFTRAKRMKALVALNWQTAPRILCTFCASGISMELLLQLRSVIAHIKDDEGAMIDEYKHFYDEVMINNPGREVYINALLNLKTK